MIQLPNNVQRISQLGLEHIHTPFLMNTGWECYYWDVFNKYWLRWKNINFNLLTQRHYSLLKNSWIQWVYSLWQWYDDFVYLMIQAFSENIANRVDDIFRTQNASYERATNVQKYKSFINFIYKV